MNVSLHSAVVASDLHVLHALLAQGVDPNLADEHGATPLHLAAMIAARHRCQFRSAAASTAVVDALLLAGADVSRRDASNRLASQLAEGFLVPSLRTAMIEAAERGAFWNADDGRAAVENLRGNTNRARQVVEEDEMESAAA